jgi:hypothetical protein
MKKLAHLINRITKGRWQFVPAETVDILQEEINRLEKSLALSPPRRSPNPARIRDLQKFLDMAG